MSSAEVQGDMRFGAQLYLDYANDPLVYEIQRPGGGTSEAFSVVQHQLTGNLNVTLGIKDRLTVFLGLPIVFVQEGEGIPASLSSVLVDGDGPAGVGSTLRPIYLANGGAGIGDLYVGGRARLYGTTEDIFMLAVQGRLMIPTAGVFDDRQHYLGERGVAGQAEVIGQLNLGQFRVLLNLGALLRPDNAACSDVGGSGPGANCFSGARQGDELTFGVGGTFDILDDESLMAIVELHGRTTFQNFFDREETPFELLAGVKYFHSSGLTVGVGGGPGLVRGFGSPDVRVFAMVGFTEAEPGEVVTVDSDGDGISDPEDTCPTEPEDADGFEDEDGCPDNDNDGDGVVDADDQCPLEAEDADGFEDENGCPDPDNDGDGVVDGSDRCPDEAGPGANQGCPWPDTDGDGVVDPLDSCVNQPGSAENHGCPEPTDVVISEGGLEILQTVYFRTGSDEIQQRSFQLLDHVASVLNEHTEVRRVRIEGHTDSRGRLERNMDLSQRRAESVMRYLVEHGVDAGRLEAHGYGPTQPIVPDARRAAEHAQNRRVVFTILDGSSGPETRTETPPEAQGDDD